MSTDIGSGGAVVSEGGGSGRKEEERNEKIIRGLLKLPPNRRCINCNSLVWEFQDNIFRVSIFKSYLFN